MTRRSLFGTSSLGRFALAVAISTLAVTGSASAQQGQGQDRQMRGEQMQGHMQDRMRQDRSRQQEMQAPREFRQIRGTIAEVKRVKVRGQDQQATLVLVETEQGENIVADLGTDPRIRVQQGAEIAVRGRPVDLGDRRVILQANAVRYEGRTIDVNRPAMARRDDMQQGMQQGRMQDDGMRGQRRAAMEDQPSRGDAQQQRGQQQRRRLQLGEFDRNQDGRFTVGEMSAGLFARFDQDQDDFLTISEWDSGFDTTFGEQAVDLDPQTWDQDGDGTISQREFRRGVRRSGLFAEFDADDSGYVTRTELRAMARAGSGQGREATADRQ